MYLIILELLEKWEDALQLIEGPLGGTVTVLQIRWGKRDNLGLIFHNTPLKHMLQPIIRTVSARRF